MKPGFKLIAIICLLAPIVLCLSFKKKEKRLVRIIIPYSESSRTIDFEYNAEGYVTSATVRDSTRLNTPEPRGSILRTIYEYDDSKRVIKEVTKYTYVTATGLYTYNPDNSLKKVDYSYEGGGAREPHYLEYVWSDGRLTGINNIQTKDGVALLSYFCTYDASGKLLKVEFNSSTDTTRRTFYSELSFDDERNFISAVKGLTNPFTVFNPDPNLFSVNNVTAYRETIFDRDRKFQYNVEYNKHYPVKFIATDSTYASRFLEYAR